MIRGLHHAQITIPPGTEGEARDFYCDVLDMQEIEKPESLRDRGGIWVLAGDTPVHIGTEPDVNRTATKAHLAYDVDDIAGWRQRLSAAGIDIIEGVPIPGFERFEFRDPFGNRVEIISPS